MPFRRLSVALLLPALVSACGGITDPSKNTVEPLNGTLPVLGSVVHSYPLSKNGEVEVTITSVSPPPTNGLIRIALGQVLSNQCQLLLGYDDSAIVNRKVPFGFLNKGTYCVVIYDPGVLTVPVTYSGTFSHP